jgi:DNA-binding transcriptional ArsR family regulator
MLRPCVDVRERYGGMKNLETAIAGAAAGVNLLAPLSQFQGGAASGIVSRHEFAGHSRGSEPSARRDLTVWTSFVAPSALSVYRTTPEIRGESVAARRCLSLSAAPQLQISDREVAKLERKASHAATILKSISNKWRLLILCQLVMGEKSVGELLEAIDLSQSALSQHLAVLRAHKLVNTRRESQVIHYSIRGDEAPVILTALHKLYCAQTVVAGAKKR